MKKKYYFIPSRKDLVMFPKVLTNISVSKTYLKNAIEKAYLSKDLIFVSLKKSDDSDIDLNVNSYYDYGVLCKIVRRFEKDDDTKIIIEGIKKAKLIELQKDNDSNYIAIVEEIEDKPLTAKEKSELNSLKIILFNKLKQYIGDSGRANVEEIFMTLDIFKSTDEALFYSCAFIFVPIPKRIEILSLDNEYKRVKKFIEFLDVEISLSQIDRKINKEVEKKFVKYQRKAYLNEKVRQIKKELADDYDDTGDTGEVANLRKKIKESKMTVVARKKCEEELKKMDGMVSYSSEYQNIKNYLEFVISIPWGKKSELKNSMKDAEKVLDKYHFGLDKIKERILEFLAVYQRKKSLTGQIICLVGAPGVGKTSLAKSIAEALNREYVKISLGGIRDEAEIRGHRKTYIGAMPGRIISSIKKANTNNPLILLDEIDKMTFDYHGDPASALLEVLDPEQNKKFEDHFLEIEYDLSNVMFIATANNISGIPVPLRDRMEIIKLSGYTEDEKYNIAIKHLIPKQLKENGLEEKEFSINKGAIITIIRKYTFEAGVRNLERELAKIIRKSVKKILTEKIKKVSVTNKNLKDFLGVEKFDYNKVDEKDRVGVSVGLAYTDFGGDLLNIESLKFSGSGKLLTTGKLGDVMKESIQASFSYVRSIADKFNISSKEFNKYDFHLHVPEGATPKDGPSAGVAITASLLSTLTNKKINRDVAMTGEISLTGKVMPIGGLKEKLLAALRGNIKKVVIPKDNEKDLDEVPDNVKENLKIIPVDNIESALKIIVQNYE